MFMISRLPKSASSEKGQTLLVVALVFLVLVGAGAMAVDVGGVLWSRGSEQNAADAAALAGVRQLPGDANAAQAVAVQYAAKNGFGDQALVDSGNAQLVASVTTAVSKTFNDNDTLTVTITRTVQPGLRAAVGAGNINVPAQAVAIVAPAVAPCDIWPWGIEDNSIVYGADGTTYTTTNGLPYGEKVVLKVPQQYQVLPGDFLALRPGDSSGTSDYRNNIINGACINNLTTIQTEPGNMGVNTQKAVDTAIQNTDPCYDPAVQLPDSVYWQVNADIPSKSGPWTGTTNNGGTTSNLPDYSTGTGGWTDPVTGLNYTIYPYGLGQPCGNTNSNVGPPDSTTPFPTVVVPSTSRVGIVPILQAGTFDAASGNHGAFYANISSFAAFYLIGTQTTGNQGSGYYVVGAFLGKVVIKNPQADYGGGLNGPLDYFLWR